MSDYPIPVERYTGDQGLICICERCNAERLIDADELNQDDTYWCPACQAHSAVMKYAEADRCGGCRKLGWFDETLNGCCSRACMFQAESLGESAGCRVTPSPAERWTLMGAPLGRVHVMGGPSLSSPEQPDGIGAEVEVVRATALADAIAAARADERQRIVERLLHAANLLDSDEVSRTAVTLEKMAAVLVVEGDAA